MTKLNTSRKELICKSTGKFITLSSATTPNIAGISFIGESYSCSNKNADPQPVCNKCAAFGENGTEKLWQ